MPRNHPLAGCDAKLRRAQQNLRFLEDELDAYLDRHPEPIPRIGHLDPETQDRLVWPLGPVDEPDLILAALIGDFIHNLRSTLDHLVFELSFRDTRGVIPDRKIAFPCCFSRAEWDSKRVQREKLRGINKTHRSMIYKAQPCYRRKDTTTDPRTIERRRRSALADLQNFWDHDKHRTLQAIASAPVHVHGEIIAIQDCEPVGDLMPNEAVFGRPLKEGTPAYWLPVRPTGPKPEVEMDIKVAVLVTFRNGLPVLNTLAKLGQWVSRAVEAFAPEFDGREARRLWDAPRGGWIEDVPIRMRTTFYTTQRADNHSPASEGN